ncbi:DUF4785 domain-containing protein [Legionella saoudiensis]|uniref:DUF4785 domain-containing protein n=1 Tax=Legionella saoudiensis TaxID=1750561 RepID=UPI000730D710|nr:DUF4785 domain-containing protein [Legionella saoudiensis]
MKTTHLFLMSAFCFSQAHAYTLPQHPTKAYECSECYKLSHQTLRASWAIAQTTLEHKVRKDQKSYSYNQVITQEQLREGVAISTRAPGAVVRITPLQKKSVPELVLQTPQKQQLSLKDASALYSQDEDLDESLLAAEHQTMTQLKPDLGFGTFILKSQTNSVHDANSYLINVFDKFSLLYLKVEPSSLQYQYGDEFSATISLKDYDTNYSVDDVNASLVGTNDEFIPLKLSKIKRNVFQAKTKLMSALNTHGDNWYVEAEVFSEQEDGHVRRTARSAFSYSIPSASLIALKKISSHPLTFAATVEVATASRYALQTVLFNQNSDGQLLPVETAQSAQWLEPGTQTIKFSFDNSKHLTEDTLSVGYLHLTDYGQLKTVYQYDEPIKLSKLMD